MIDALDALMREVEAEVLTPGKVSTPGMSAGIGPPALLRVLKDCVVAVHEIRRVGAEAAPSRR